MSNYKVRPITIFGEKQINVVKPTTLHNSDGSIEEIFPEDTIDIDLKYPSHLYAWNESGGKINIFLDEAKYQTYSREIQPQSTEVELFVTETTMLLAKMQQEYDQAIAELSMAIAECPRKYI